MSRKRKRSSITGDIDKSVPPGKRPNISKANSNQPSRHLNPTTTGATAIENTQQVHSHPVLSRYYKKVVSLRTYILSSLPSSSKSRRRKVAYIGLLTNSNKRGNGKGKKSNPSHDDSAPKNTSVDGTSELARLLDTTLIGILKKPDQATTQARQRDLASFTQSQARSTLDSTDTGATCPQSEIVDFVILTLFNRTANTFNKSQHLLCHGFQRAGPRHESGAMAGSIQGVVPQYPNQNVSMLRRGVWAEVLGLLGNSGEEVMMGLLLDCGIFVCVDEGKGNYYQLSGVPLSDLEVVDNLRSTPNGEKADGKAVGPPLLHTPGNIVFVRRRMLYARAVLNAKGGIRFGLRHKHVLNRCSDSSNIKQTIHIMKYIFPRQFGLHNVFTSRIDKKETAQPLKDYTLREDEIEAADRAIRMKKGLKVKTEGNGDGDSEVTKTKLPKRLRGDLVQLIHKLQKRHTRCAYSELLRHYCPIEQPPTPTTSQISLTHFATPVSSVSAFCRATLLKLVPNELLYGIGEDAVHNREHISKCVDIFIRIRRYESLTLHRVVQGMKLACIKWLEPPQCRGGKNISLSDMRKRTEILQELVYYIFDSILIPLIRSNFYVTESNVHRNRLFYFRHDVWRKLTEPSLTELKTSVFEEMPNDKAVRVLNQRNLGFSQLRLLPKTTGARPITNLRRRAVVTSKGWNNGMLGLSINSLMTPVFNMLGYEKEKQPEKLGSAMFSVQDMYPKLRDFRQKLLSCQPAGTGRRSPKPLFFVKLDIKSCFDTIPQHKLLSLAEQLVSEDEYRVTKHAEIRPPEGCSEADAGSRKPTRKFITKARDVTDFTSLLERVSEGAGATRKHTVFVDTAGQKKHNAQTLLDLLAEHVRMNLVKIGKKYYRQKNGIPQGSVLSSLLCNFFYGDLENEVLSFLRQSDPSDPHESLLLRLIDDFLLITTDRNRATRFLELMIAGQPDYGITVNAQKSLVNFPITINGSSIPRSTGNLFPYCGSLIDTRTLEINREDRSLLLQPKPSTKGPTTSDSLSISTSQTPGHSFNRKSLSSFRFMSSNPMFLDTSHNSSKVVVRSLYDNFLAAAMRMERYLKELKRQGGCTLGVGLVIKTIGDVMDLGVRIVRGKRGGRQGGFECSVTDSQIRWLAARAFGKVFGRRQTGYREVVGWLEGVEKGASRPRGFAGV